jgi:hypothetical protein
MATKAKAASDYTPTHGFKAGQLVSIDLKSVIGQFDKAKAIDAKILEVSRICDQVRIAQGWYSIHRIKGVA